MRILVTGSASHLGRVLLPHLLQDPRVEQVIGVDLRDTDFHHPLFTQVLMDVRSPQLKQVMRNCDALVHLAFVVMQGDLGARRNDRAWMRDINVAGTQAVFTLAAAQGIHQLVQLSSSAVYRLPADATAIDEAHAREALPGFAYGEDKVAVEQWLDRFESEHGRLRLLRLRPHAILGPHAQPYLRRLLGTPFYPRLPEPQPLTQCVHEDDVAEAIRLALFSKVRGAFNLATSDALSFRDMHRLARWPSLPLKPATVERLFRLAWRTRGWGTDPAWLQGAHHPLVLDTRAAREQLGWRPQHDTVRAVIAHR